LTEDIDLDKDSGEDEEGDEDGYLEDGDEDLIEEE
jgi:hypothetical protein